ncbi:hypothetical protein LOK74_16620 [Brevibacillus humidisoli]|uniref:hypothetical protein n=1 Tax=Brevibacillus humidisoli TaxID=2895522 RepID=UPI001E563121|nr:hypothetical protein [Brevibacillus humidisoli]UFJ39668.1 hypothetical protein LOK74_16620 [Brevibacillus humidisoli]
MEELVARMYELRELQKQVEDELEQLRTKILARYPVAAKVELDDYRMSVTYQERRDYDDERLYAALPDPGIWKMLSKSDPSKISSMLKLHVIDENILKGTYDVRRIPVLRITKR